MTQNAASGIVAAVLADQSATLTQQGSVTAIADNEAMAALFAPIFKAVAEGQTGTTAFSPQRLANAITNIPATAVTAGTPVTLLTSAAGKKWRLLAYSVSLSVAGSVIFKEAGSEVLRTPLMAAGIGLPSGPMGNGTLAANPADTLQIDVSATGSVSGWIATMQE